MSIVPINQFMKLEDLYADTPLQKIIYVWGKYQVRYTASDGLEHYKWKILFSEVRIVEGKAFSTDTCYSRDKDEVYKFYDYYQL